MFLMFEGIAEKAMNFYVSLFGGSKIVSVERYGPGLFETRPAKSHAQRRRSAAGEACNAFAHWLKGIPAATTV